MKKSFLGAGLLLLSVLYAMPLFAQENPAPAAEAAATPAEKPAPAANENEKKNYTGWVDVSSKEQDVKIGLVQIKVKPNLGTFNFSVLNENDKYVPLLSTANEYTSSGFFLKAGKKRYRLIADKNVFTSISKIDSGISLIYKVGKVAEVNLKFEAMKTAPDHDIDMIRIAANVKNVSQKTDEFALRAILDTVLGETGDFHFFGADNSPVKNEVLYRNLKDHRWIYSRNSNAEMQILLDGADITVPESVALVNYSTLDQAYWEPDMAAYRSFDTVLSYKNSAFGINWPSCRLKPEQSADFVFYIAVAADGDLAKGSSFVGGDEPVKEVEEPSIFTNLPSPVPAPVERPVETPKKKAEPIDEFAVRRDVPFNVNNLSKEQLTLEYVQNLIDRISALEENNSSVNRKEILQLNAELDAILSVLRQQ